MHLNVIKEGAIFISDAHLSQRFTHFKQFLKDIDQQKIKTPQLFLMGDIFDLLFGGVSFSISNHRSTIDLINKISKVLPIIYFEGNHDFNLKIIFPYIKIFTYSQQPAIFKYKKQTVLLSHGDQNQGIGYRIYTSIIRHPLSLFILNKIDKYTKNSISIKLTNHLNSKDICSSFEGFKSYITTKYQTLDLSIDVIIEGHYHQGDTFKIKHINYYNLNAFTCNKSFFRVKLAL